jgi:hypothetical protein
MSNINDLSKIEELKSRINKTTNQDELDILVRENVLLFFYNHELNREVYNQRYKIIGFDLN